MGTNKSQVLHPTDNKERSVLGHGDLGRNSQNFYKSLTTYYIPEIYFVFSTVLDFVK